MNLFRKMSLLLVLVPVLMAQQPTPNIGLQIPPTGSNNWNIPLNFNFSRLDQLLSGNLPIKALQITNNVVVGGTIQANGGFVGQGGTTLATAAAANQYSPVYYFGGGSSSALAGVSPFTGLLKYRNNAPPIPATAPDIVNLFGGTCTGTNVLQANGLCAQAAGGGLSPGLATQMVFYAADGTQGGPSNVQVDSATKNFLTAPNTNGYFNTDRYRTGTSNNGLSTLLSATCLSGGCTAMYPGNSTSTESVVLNVSDTHVSDFRHGTLADWYYNSTPTGLSSKAIDHFQSSTYDASTIATNGFQDQNAEYKVLNFNSPGWNVGTGTGSLTSLWSTQHGENMVMNIGTPGIGQMHSGTMFKHAVGDSAAFYYYSMVDGGFVDGSGEGSTGGGLQRLQNSTWLHARANPGSTHGATVVSYTFTSGGNSRPDLSIGGYLLDISRQNNGHVIGAPTLVTNYLAWAMPVDISVTPSSAYGRASTAIPSLANSLVPQTDTVTFTVDGGSNAAGYAPGVACMDGEELYEQVAIVSVGTINSSNHTQSVTFTHRFPNGLVSSLWQGGPCSNYFVPQLTYLNGWATGYPVFGSTDGLSLIGRFFTGTGPGLPSRPIPTLYGTSTVNVPLTSLTVSGSTVTATFGGSAISLFNGLSSAVISDSVGGAFDGPVFSVKAINNNQLQWTQPGMSGTSLTAKISYSDTQFGFYLIQGAAVIQAVAGGVKVEPNDVFWTNADQLENVFNPAFRGAVLSLSDNVNSPDTNVIGGTSTILQNVIGLGISGQYTAYSWGNNNPLNMYWGGGGTFQPPTVFKIAGPTSTLINMQFSPIDSQPIFVFGGPISGQSTSNDVKIMQINNTGLFNYNPAGNSFFLTNLSSQRFRSPILSTGLGLNNSNEIAITAANNITNDGAMGRYGVVGSETPLDTSGTLAAKQFIAGSIVGGALPPIINGILVSGTPGTSNYAYGATCVTQTGETRSPTLTQTFTGNATLDPVTNFNGMNITPGYGCQSVNVYRVAAPAPYTTGLICANVANNLANGTSTSFGCKDSGQTAGAAQLPTVDTSGLMQSHQGIFDNLTASKSIINSVGLQVVTASLSTCGAMTQFSTECVVTVALPIAEPDTAYKVLGCTAQNTSASLFVANTATFTTNSFVLGLYTGLTQTVSSGTVACLVIHN